MFLNIFLQTYKPLFQEVNTMYIKDCPCFHIQCFKPPTKPNKLNIGEFYSTVTTEFHWTSFASGWCCTAWPSTCRRARSTKSWCLQTPTETGTWRMMNSSLWWDRLSCNLCKGYINCYSTILSLLNDAFIHFCKNKLDVADDEWWSRHFTTAAAFILSEVCRRCS